MEEPSHANCYLVTRHYVDMGHSTVAVLSFSQLFVLAAAVLGVLTAYFRDSVAGVVGAFRR
jgi:hypothetical protein